MRVNLNEEAAWTERLTEPAAVLSRAIHLGRGLSRDNLFLAGTTTTLIVSGLCDVVFDGKSTLLHTRRGVVAESIYLMDPALIDVPVRTDPIEIEGAGRFVIGHNKACYNYYHWIVQCLTAIYAYTISKPGIRPKVLLPPPYMGWQTQTLDLADLPIDRFYIDQERQYRFDELEVSNCLTGALDFSPSPLVKPLFEKLKARTGSVTDERLELRRLIYVSRTDSVLRKLDNEEAVIALVERYGFDVVALTTLSFDEQVRLFRQADVVVGPHGAGLTNIAFCDSRCKVYELTPEHYINCCFVNLAQVQNLEYWIDVFPSLPGDETHFRRWTADLEAVERRLNEVLAAAYRHHS